MNHGIYKVSAVSPHIALCDVRANVGEIKKTIDEACAKDVRLLVLPELCVTGGSAGDLFLLDSVLGGAEEGVYEIAEYTEGKNILVAFGSPFMYKGLLYNVTVYASQGRVIAVSPKKVAENGFSAYDGEVTRLENLDCPFGNNLILWEKGGLTVASELGDELLSPLSSSAYLATHGALVICNPAHSVAKVAKADYVRALITTQSARLLCSYVRAESGEGESSTDGVYSGHCIISSGGNLLDEALTFGSGVAVADIDVSNLNKDRIKSGYYNQRANFVEFSLTEKTTPLTRRPEPHPFFPADCEKDKRAEEILQMQTAGLAGRMKSCGINSCVIGISGGLDSTLALLVAVRAVDKLGLPRKSVTAVTMPCFGTTARTKSNAYETCRILGVDFMEINIGESVKRHLADIGHDGTTADVTFENAQARERTQVLFDVANRIGALVVGTGDMSEIALGWCTYNGDHMSSYSVNASVPKTLVRKLVAYEAERLPELSSVLVDIIDTPVSPELLPTDGKVVQPTEEIVGPYELHDFFLYHFIRHGSSKAKILRLAISAFEGTYDEREIEKWLNVFFRRFYSSAFKRTCAPGGVGLGSVSLSPRTGWKMSDEAKNSE